MSEQLSVNRVNGYAKGVLTIKDDRSSPSTPTEAGLRFETRGEADVDLSHANAATLALLGTENVANAAGADVAAVVVELNALIDALAAMGVITNT